jgi:hypothetical protein
MAGGLEVLNAEVYLVWIVLPRVLRDYNACKALHVDPSPPARLRAACGVCRRRLGACLQPIHAHMAKEKAMK